MEAADRQHLSIISKALGQYELTPLLSWALRFFLRNRYESLLLTDSEGVIQFMDRGSEKLFGLGDGEAKGIHINKLVPDAVFPRVLETGYASIGRVLNLKGVNKISSAYPLVKNGEVIGSIGRVLFHSLEEYERVISETKRLKKEVRVLRQRERREYRALYTFEDIMGNSESLKDCIKLSERMAFVETDVLIAGESGTGKELFAQAIHNYSGPDRPFVRVNCPAIPFELAESEFFGYERGAFSGASRTGKKGKFEVADGGSIFLDEINSLPLSIQGKLLRVFQEREVEKIGGTKTEKLNFRIIATTNTDLQQAVKAGTFREDLYYRIAKTSIHLPPLRDRIEDIPVYITHFLTAINKRFGTDFKRASEEVLKCFGRYHWPGNVRQLISVLEQACLEKWTGESLSKDALPDWLWSTEDKVTAFGRAKEQLNETHKSLIRKALKDTNGNKRQAAKALGMSRSTFYTKLKEYNIHYNPSE